MWEMKKVSLVKIWQTKKIFKQFSFILVIDPKITNTDRGWGWILEMRGSHTSLDPV